jgi:hypothetical protein
MEPQLVDVRNLVGAGQIAERLGLEHTQSVSVMRRRSRDFPDPVADVGASLVWDWAEVASWARRHGHLR